MFRQSVLLVFFTLVIFSSSLDSVEGSYVCPRLEDTISYLESDQDNQDEFPDYINITSDECEDLFSYFPGWLIIVFIINMSISVSLTFYTWCKSGP